MSAPWTLGRLRDGDRGSCGSARRLRDRPLTLPASARALLALARDPEVVLRRRCRPAPAPSRPTPRGWGSTAQGLCVLHEPPTPMEYPRPSSSSPRPSCSTRPAPLGQLRATRPAPPGGAGRSSRVRVSHPTGVSRRHDPRDSQKP